MRTTAHRLKDKQFPNFWTEVDPHWDYDDFYKDAGKDYYDAQISFDCVLADDQRDQVWCGVATFGRDICYAFERKTGQFKKLDYAGVGDRYDAKFHRALQFDNDGKLWAATAMLHDPAHYFDAPGGAIVKIDPDTDKIEIVDRPIKHCYIQSIIFDNTKRYLFGQTYTPEWFFRYDTQTGECKVIASLGQSGGGEGSGLYQCEQLAVDRNNNVWGACGMNRAWGHTMGLSQHRLLRYESNTQTVHHMKTSVPTLTGGSGKVDAYAVGPDGEIYASTVGEGLLHRIDPDTLEIHTVGVPGTQKGQRLSAMKSFKNGKLYGVCGKGGVAELFSYDPKADQLERIGVIYDNDSNIGAYQIHDITICDDGTIFAGENDVPHRSSYLWEIQGAID